ncbi:hypothetical protein [Synechococcus elongatus]
MAKAETFLPMKECSERDRCSSILTFKTFQATRQPKAQPSDRGLRHNGG